MKAAMATKLAAAFLLGGALAGHWAFGNGGPFVVKYPSGDPAAKGVLARLDPTLKPAQETRLRVVNEDLTVCFGIGQRNVTAATPPRVEVTAAYTIENPTGEDAQVDFGFPILRGIYLIQGMALYPDVDVTIDKQCADTTIISNSVIYGMIRQNAREVVEKGIAANAKLARLTAAVRAAWVAPNPTAPSQPPTVLTPAGTLVPSAAAPAERTPTADYLPARDNLQKYLTNGLHWNERDAALLVEYASLEFGVDENEWRAWSARPLGRLRLVPERT